MIKEIKYLAPLSVNKCWQGRRFKTKEYEAYEKQLGLLLGFCQNKVEGWVNIDFTFYLPRRSFGKSDIDNFLKPALDVLTKKGCINDDRKVVELKAKKVLADYYGMRIIIQKANMADETLNPEVAPEAPQSTLEGEKAPEGNPVPPEGENAPTGENQAA